MASDRLRAFRRLIAQVLRKISSRIDPGWYAHGRHITFNTEGFVEARNAPDLLARHNYETRSIRRLLAASGEFRRSLEVGCGYGRLSMVFAEFSPDHTAVDINPDALELARSRYPDLRFEEASLGDLPFESQAFDLVVTWTVLQHIPPSGFDECMAELRRVTAANCVVLMCEETSNPGHPTRHSWHRSEDEYRDAMSGFSLVTSSYIEEIDRIQGMRSPGRIMLFSKDD